MQRLTLLLGGQEHRAAKGQEATSIPSWFTRSTFTVKFPFRPCMIRLINIDA